MNKTKQTLISIFSFCIILTLTGTVFAQDVGSDTQVVIHAEEEPGEQYSSASLFGNDVIVTYPDVLDEGKPSSVGAQSSVGGEEFILVDAEMGELVGAADTGADEHPG